MTEFDASELTKLAADLGQAAARIVPDTESKVLTVVGRKVHADAVAAAPRLTGDLAASIYLRGGQGWRDIGTPLKQGFFQEFGTSRHPPQPWLYPAGDRGAEELVQRLDGIADPLP